MRLLRPLSTSLLGVLLALSACGGGEPADEAATESMAAAQAPPPECYLARGTREEAEARPSPLRETVLSLGRGEARLCYGAPSASGRTVMGALVPMGQPWRTGANEATALHASFPLTVGGVALEPGRYSLYTTPGPESWEVHLNGVFDRWGIPITPEVREADLGSFSVTPEATESTVETLTFRWEPSGEGSGSLIMEWENTRIRIPVSAGM